MTNEEGAVSWLPLIITVLGVQIFQFMMLGRIIKLYKRKKSEMAFSNVNDSEKAEAEDSDVYEKRFYNDRWWALVVTGVSYIAVGIYALIYPAE